MVRLNNKVKRNKSTILIAEDDPDDQLLLREAVRDAGIEDEIIIALDGQELMEYLQKIASSKVNRPHLILLDLNMPRKDGRETLKDIKASPKYDMIPVVILTTSNSDDDKSRCYDLGAAGYVVKPSRYSELVRIISGLYKYWSGTNHSTAASLL